MNKRKKSVIKMFLSQLVLAVMIFNLGAVNVVATEVKGDVPQYLSKTPFAGYYMFKYKNRILAKYYEWDAGFAEINENGEISDLSDDANQALWYNGGISKITGKSQTNTIDEYELGRQQYDFNTNTVTTLNENIAVKNAVNNKIEELYGELIDSLIDPFIRINFIDDQENWVKVYIDGYVEDENYEWPVWIRKEGVYNVSKDMLIEFTEGKVNTYPQVNNGKVYVRESMYVPEENKEYVDMIVIDGDGNIEKFEVEEYAYPSYIFNNGKCFLDPWSGLYELQGNIYKKVLEFKEPEIENPYEVIKENSNSRRAVIENLEARIKYSNGRFNFGVGNAKGASLYSSLLYVNDDYSIDVNDNLWRLHHKDDKAFIEKYENGKFVSKYEVDSEAIYLDVYNDNSLVVNTIGEEGWYTTIDIKEATAGEKLVVEITNLPEIITLDHKATVEALVAKYNNLSQEEKNKVTNYEKLTKAVETISALEEEKKVNEEIANLIEDINKLPETITLENKETVEILVVRYNALNEVNRAKVTNSAKLLAANVEIDKLVNGEVVTKPTTGNVSEVEVSNKLQPGEDTKVYATVDKAAETVKVVFNDIEAFKGNSGSATIVLDNNMTVKVPYGAISPDLIKEGSKIELNIKMDESDAAKEIVKGIKGVKKVFDYSLAVVTNGESVAISSFGDSTVEITIELTDEELADLDKAKLTVFYYNETTKKFEAMPTTVDGNKVTFTTPHFSKFIIAEKAKVTGGTNGSTGEVLPQTGGQSVSTLAMLGLLAIGAGTVTLRRKAK